MITPPPPTARWLRAVLAACAACLVAPGCLPDRLTDKQIDEKIKAARQCGNGEVEPSEGETCDDSNDKLCDGCEECSLRKVLEIKEPNDMLVMHTSTLGGLKVPRDGRFSVELWFKLKGTLLQGKSSVLIARGAEGTGRAFGLGLVGAQGSNGVQPVCWLSVTDGKPNKNNTAFVAPFDYVLKADEWHHIVCGYDGPRNMLGITADLNPLKETQAKVPTDAEKNGSIFSDKDFVAFGRLSDLAQISEVPFDGLLDELRWSSTYPSKQPQLKRRYDDDEPDTVFLLHLDGASQDAPGQVKTADDAASAATLVATHVLSFADDNCYGSDAAALICDLADTPPPWCEDAPK